MLETVIACIAAVVMLCACIYHAGWNRGKPYHYRNGWNDAHFPNGRYRGND